jgi:hypothetical protein
VRCRFEDGVLEFGNLRSSPQWATLPNAPIMPKVQLRQAFEELGALYALFWSLEGDVFRVKADYESPRDRKTRLMLRGDGNSFTKVSRGLTLDANGNGPVAKALQSGEELTVSPPGSHTPCPPSHRRQSPVPTDGAALCGCCCLI